MAEHSIADSLTTTIEAEHARLQEALADLGNDEMLQAGAHGDWSVKDVLAHLTYWEGQLVRALRQAADGEDQTPMDAAGEEIDVINARVVAASRAHPLDEVRAAFTRSFAELLAVLATLRDDDLAATGELDARLGQPAQPFITAITYEHYQEHHAALQNWLDTTRRGAGAEGR